MTDNQKTGEWLEDRLAEEKTAAPVEKPQIFLLGDSIRQGYCATVKNDLADRFDVIYPKDNCRFTQHVLVSLGGWRGLTNPASVKAVHFNCGHWDIAHWNGAPFPLTSLDEYRTNIGHIIIQLRHFFPNAALFAATTTPMNPNGQQGGNPRTTDEIRLYNAALCEACAEAGVKVNDMFAYAEHWGPERFADYCHLTGEGFADLGHEVSEFLTKELG